jgi:hypothetical protein
MLIMNNKKGDTPIVSKKPSFAEKLTANTPENLTSMAEGDGEGEDESDAMQAAGDFFTAIEQKDRRALIDAFQALDMAVSTMEEETGEEEAAEGEGESMPKSSGKDPKALMAILMSKRKP